MQIAEATEENENMIKNAHDTKLTEHQGILKTLKKLQEKTTWKSIKADVKRYVKNCPTYAIKNTTVHAKKIASTITATRNIFSKARIRFRHWVTGITKPNDRNML